LIIAGRSNRKINNRLKSFFRLCTLYDPPEVCIKHVVLETAGISSCASEPQLTVKALRTRRTLAQLRHPTGYHIVFRSLTLMCRKTHALRLGVSGMESAMVRTGGKAPSREPVKTHRPSVSQGGRIYTVSMRIPATKQGGAPPLSLPSQYANSKHLNAVTVGSRQRWSRGKTRVRSRTRRHLLKPSSVRADCGRH